MGGTTSDGLQEGRTFPTLLSVGSVASIRARSLLLGEGLSVDGRMKSGPQVLRTLTETHFPQLLAAFRALRNERALARPAVQTSFGFRFGGPAVMLSGQFELEETKLFQALIRESDLLINAGANTGYYCCLALQAGRYVIALEPIPSNVRQLLRNLRENGWAQRAEVYPVAVGDCADILEIYGEGTGASLVRGWAGTSTRHVSLVPIVPIDTVIGTRLVGRQCLVVMDIEGSEYKALLGARGLLAQNPKPHWIVEISVGEHQPVGTVTNPRLLQTFAVFWDSGYEAWTATCTPRRVEHAEVDAVARGGTDTLGTHNFLFVAPENRPNVLTKGIHKSLGK